MSLIQKHQPVLFAGENHLITLYYPSSAKKLISVSCWRATYSAEGTGWAIFIVTDAKQAAQLNLPERLILTDNPPLASMVAQRFNQYFAGFEDLGFDTLPPKQMEFQQTAEEKLYRVTGVSDDLTLELLWYDRQNAALEVFYNTSGPIPYDVSAVICPCQDARIVINNQTLNGEIHRPDGASASSAFLAFSETWVLAQSQVSESQ